MQKMSEKDAIFVLKRIEAHGPLPIMAKEVAIQALEEIQQYLATGMTPEQIKEMQMDYCAKGAVLEEYKAIGTVKELKAMKENGAFSGSELALIALNLTELKKYQAIGTLDQCREAVERMKPKKVEKWANGEEHCPNCDCDNSAIGYGVCIECGQVLDWSE